MDGLKTQPIRDRNAVWHHFGRTAAHPDGLIMRHVNGNSYESITIDGKHQQYFVAEDVVYEPTLDAQRMRTGR